MRNTNRSFSGRKSNGQSNHYQSGRSSNGSRPRQFSRGRYNAPQFDPTNLVKTATPANPVSDTPYQPTHAFADFAITDQLKQNIIARGFTSPTPIQDQVIPLILEGKDVVGQAATGTGKTAAFLIPLIHQLITDPKSKVLIIAPTRELAIQIAADFKPLAIGLNMYSVLCIGGASLFRQSEDLRRPHQFVIGTPGRLKDLHQRGRLNLHQFNHIVLDEVDRMLDMGFIHDVDYLISGLISPRQSLFFSATLPPKVQEVMRQFLHKPTIIAIKSAPTHERINQDVVHVGNRSKIEVLHDLLIKPGFDKVLVFGRTKWGMEKLSKDLYQRGFKVASIHGNKSQGQRQRALQDFKRSTIQVLLATDIASRGLDIDNVTHVINFDLPESYEDYIHRIGRTGRADRTGTALTFVN